MRLLSTRPGKYFPIEEDERGTYIFSSLDLNMLDHLPEMKEAGIASLKIEGRMKTEYYVATVTRAYRLALDLLARSVEDYRAALPGLREELLKCSHRLSNTGFYFGPPSPASGAAKTEQTMLFAGKVLGMREGLLRIEVKNRFAVGDTLEVLTPGAVHPLTVRRILLEDSGEEVQAVTMAGLRVCVPAPFSAEAGDYLRRER